jgi:hypothetical protein
VFSELFPANIRATAVSSALQIGRGMSFFPPLLAAALLPVFGYQPIVFISAALFGCLSLLAFAFKETRGISMGATQSIRASAPASDSDSDSASVETRV